MGFIAPALPFISLGATLLGGVMEAQGQRAAGEARAQAGTFNRQVLQNAAVVARHNARRAGEIGREQVTDLAETGLRLTSRQITSLAANGVVVDSGSGLDLVADTNARIRRNIARKRQETVDRQAGFISRAQDLEVQGQLAEITGSNAAAAANQQATTTLVRTGSKVAFSWYELDLLDDDGADTDAIGDILTLGTASSGK